MITFGDIFGLAFLVAVPVIGVIIYNEHQNDVIGWKNNAQRDKEIDDFRQFLISHESANKISLRELEWYIREYCETKSKDWNPKTIEDKIRKTRKNILGDLSNHKRLLDKYKNTENFNEVEFFQELNEALKKEQPRERSRIERAINRGCYMEWSGKYICDFNNVIKLEVRDIGGHCGKYTDISLKDGKVVNAQGDEVIELFNKWKNKQNLI